MKIEVYYLNNKSIKSKFVGDQILFRPFFVSHNPCSTFSACLELRNWCHYTSRPCPNRPQILTQNSQLLRSSTVTPRKSRKWPKCPSPVAARSGFRLPQDLQGSIIWWLPSAQFMLYTCVRTMRAEFTTQGSTNNRGCKLWFRRILARFMLPLAMLHCHGIQWQAV